MSDPINAIVAKFMGNAGLVLPKDAAAALCDRILALDAGDGRALGKTLRPG